MKTDLIPFQDFEKSLEQNLQLMERWAAVSETRSGSGND